MRLREAYSIALYTDLHILVSYVKCICARLTADRVRTAA